MTGKESKTADTNSTNPVITEHHYAIRSSLIAYLRIEDVSSRLIRLSSSSSPVVRLEQHLYVYNSDPMITSICEALTSSNS